MHDAALPVALDELLAHRAWVRDLARGLARDEHEAADAEQATWVAAIRRPPVARTSLRGWLAVTTRNAVAKLRRSERRRVARETAAPARDDVVDASELAARAEAHRCVVEAVLRLPEPLRAALLLRYFQGLPVAEAAARLGVSERTLRDRIHEGLARLREDLEPRFGGQAVLGAALGTLQEFEGSGVGGAVVAGGAVVGTVTKAALALVAVLLLAGGVWRLASGGATVPGSSSDGIADADGGPASPDGEPSAKPAPAARPGAPRARRPGEDVAQHAPANAANAANAGTAPASPPGSPGDPVPGAAVAPRGPDTQEAPTEAPPDVETRLRRATLVAEWQDSTILRVLADVSQRTDVPVWAPPDIAAGGGTRVTFSVDGMQTGGVLGMVARMGRLDVRVEKDRVVLASQGVADADLVLVPRFDALPRERTTVLVTDTAGSPVAGATIRRLLGGAAVATTGIDGRAEIRDVLPFPRVFARLDGSEDSTNQEPRADRETTLRLGGASARLTVRVRDRSGKPAPGAAIRVVPAATGRGPRFPDEQFVTGADGSYVHASCPAREVRVTVRFPGHATDSRTLPASAGENVAAVFDLAPESVVEGIVRNADGTPAPQITVSAMQTSGTGGRCVTDSEGRFRIPGLAVGTWQVGGKRSFSEFASAEVVLALGETRRIELTLPPSPGR